MYFQRIEQWITIVVPCKRKSIKPISNPFEWNHDTFWTHFITSLALKYSEVITRTCQIFFPIWPNFSWVHQHLGHKKILCVNFPMENLWNSTTIFIMYFHYVGEAFYWYILHEVNDFFFRKFIRLNTSFYVIVYIILNFPKSTLWFTDFCPNCKLIRWTVLYVY